ncbi:hypothetical protein CYMTET_32332 [Cymbomonas tetramitiformis]|nr:hypothetical protein CYMTET_32332 [Cymbomonas tetramitiformis]
MYASSRQYRSTYVVSAVDSKGVGQLADGRYAGNVKFFHQRQGFGFIIPEDKETFGDKDVFVHHKSISGVDGERHILLEDEAVEFGYELQDGKFQALEVTGPDNLTFKGATRVKCGEWIRSPVIEGETSEGAK